MHSLTRRPTYGMLARSLLLASASAARAQQVPSRAEVARVADSLATNFLAARGAPGLSIAIMRGRDTLVLGGWGAATKLTLAQGGRSSDGTRK